MLISTPKLSDDEKGFTLTPTMIRGAFLLWRSELERGQQRPEIKDLDQPTPGNVSEATPGDRSNSPGESTR